MFSNGITKHIADISFHQINYRTLEHPGTTVDVPFIYIQGVSGSTFPLQPTLDTLANLQFFISVFELDSASLFCNWRKVSAKRACHAKSIGSFIVFVYNIFLSYNFFITALILRKMTLRYLRALSHAPSCHMYCQKVFSGLVPIGSVRRAVGAVQPLMRMVARSTGHVRNKWIP